MDEEKKKLFPRGAIYRIAKPTVLEKECRISPAYADAINKYISKLVVDITVDAIDVVKSKNRKTLDVESLKAAAEKRGILIE